jgi:hypothetical protein
MVYDTWPTPVDVVTAIARVQRVADNALVLGAPIAEQHRELSAQPSKQFVTKGQPGA